MKKIIDFCEKFNMLPHSGTILCAVSGGKDSVFLLEVLQELSPKIGFSLACAHFDHGLRGAESERDRFFVEDRCKELGLPCFTGFGDVSAFAEKNGFGIEEAARSLRYKFLEKTAEEIGAVRIATAHTADDNAETFLLNLMRGSGLRGLCGIPPVRGKIIRPLLEISADEILNYLNERKIAFVEDSTNAGDDYARNRIRHRVIPALRELGPGFDENILRCISFLREDEAFISGLALDFIDERLSENSLPAKETARLPTPLAARVIKGVAGEGLSAAHVAAVLALAAGENPHAKADLPGVRVFREYDRLIFGGGEEKHLEEKALIVGQTQLLEPAGLQITSRSIPACTEINNSDNIFFFQRDSICGRIAVRARKEGDLIRLYGRNCTKTLKKLFAESGLNGAGKGLIPVFCDEAGVIAVSGFGIAERCVPKAGDDVIYVSITRAEQI